jgi:hypothetical protein
MKWPPLCRSSIAGAERNTANSRHRSDRPFGFEEVEREFCRFENFAVSILYSGRFPNFMN